MLNPNSIYKSTTAQKEIMAFYDRVLSRWPVPCDHLYLPTRYGNTFIIASGAPTAPPLVLLHGTGSNSATWAGDVAAYSHHFRVYAVDMPGEPGKSAPDRFSWEGPAFAEWLDDLLDGLNLEKASLGGMSLGAWAALKYALYRPDRVAKLIIICPSGIYPPRLSFILRAIVFSFLGEWGRNRLKRFMFKDISFPAEVDQFLTLLSRHFNYRPGSPPLFTDEELHSLSMPVLYLAGEKDALLNTPKTAERLQKWVPNLTLNILKEEGHVIINLAPQILSFLLRSEVS